MAAARHSYEIKAFEPNPTDLDEKGHPRLRRLPGPFARAEGINLDAARESARALVVEKTGRVVRSLNVERQVRTRSNGPTTGSIVVVVHGPERKKVDRTMAASRLSRGLPREIVK